MGSMLSCSAFFVDDKASQIAPSTIEVKNSTETMKEQEKKMKKNIDGAPVVVPHFPVNVRPGLL